MSATEVYIGLGSNVGERERQLAQAVEALPARGFHVQARSSLYLTEPVDAPPQEWFLNAVVGGRTELSPERLLQVCLEVEQSQGRVRLQPRGPRTLDLDLLLYGQQVREGPDLVLPHPRLHERLFVLVPLEEIAPDLRHPRLGLTVSELRRRCPDRSRVVLHASMARS